MAISTKNLPLFKILLEHGADVKKKDMYGWSALHLAAEMGYIPVVTALLENGADPNYQTESRVSKAPK